MDANYNLDCVYCYCCTPFLGAFLRFLSHWRLADQVLILCLCHIPSEPCRLYLRWETTKFCIFRAGYITGLAMAVSLAHQIQWTQIIWYTITKQCGESNVGTPLLHQCSFSSLLVGAPQTSTALHTLPPRIHTISALAGCCSAVCQCICWQASQVEWLRYLVSSHCCCGYCFGLSRVLSTFISGSCGGKR